MYNEDYFLFSLTFSDAVVEYYSMPNNSCGGNCHIVLDDLNIKDQHIELCEKQCFENSDWLGMKLMQFLLEIPEEKRRSYLVAGEEQS